MVKRMLVGPIPPQESVGVPEALPVHKSTIVKVTNTAPLLLVRCQRRRRRDSPCGGGGGGAVWAFVVICYGACVADPL
jgi:hypothetical protein